MRTLCRYTRASIALVSLALVASSSFGDTVRADSHAPIGVMGDHTHQAGEFMFSYRFMSMTMDGNRSGSDFLSPLDIATSVPNRFFGSPMQPPTLRVVPLDMRMDMHMFGMMYAPTSWLTLMGMTSYKDNSMDHVTFQGGVG